MQSSTNGAVYSRNSRLISYIFALFLFIHCTIAAPVNTDNEAAKLISQLYLKAFSQKYSTAISRIPTRLRSQILSSLDLEEGVIERETIQNSRISQPTSVLPMIAVPPRDQIPGSTKGMPYKVRLIHPHKKVRQPARFFRRRIFGNNNDENVEAEEHGPFTVDLHGGIVGVGEYFTIIKIGGRKIRVQVDTGSSTLAVPMKGCKSCIKKSNPYSVDESTTGKTISCNSDQCTADRCTNNCEICSIKGACCSTERPKECGFSLKYADGSAASGSVVQDEMEWGTLKANVTFGGILKNSANFERPEVDGILGMAFKSLACNPSCFDPAFDSFVQTGIVKDVFSICMTRTGGKLMLGGYDPKVAQSPIEYVQLAHSGAERYYRVELSGTLQIGDEKVAMPNFRNAIVDTGTTLIVVSTKTFAKIKEHFQKRYCDVPELCDEESWLQSGMCVSLSDKDLTLLPNLTLVVGNKVKLVLRPDDYMLSYVRGKKKYRCVGIMGMDGLGGMVVLGNTLMQRYVTVYDRESGRIGFGEAAPGCGDSILAEEQLKEKQGIESR